MTDRNRPKLEFSGLVEKIQSIHHELKRSALRSVNTMLTIRSWLIGYYITNYEMQGADRAQYGERLMDSISLELQRLKVPRSAKRELQRFCQFYRTYPLIVRSLNAELGKVVWGDIKPEITVTADSSVFSPKVRSVNAQLAKLSSRLLNNLSYAHFEILITIEDELKRRFYELECLKANWSVRELRRQVYSLFYERTALSREKEKLAELANAESESFDPVLTIRDPYVFEFLGVKSDSLLSESDLEDQLLDNLQEFLLELGHGFCFEARQKRILIGDTQFYIDLVFYHRVLKCHVLIELKVAEFNHENIGQLNTYVSWYRANEMREGDNPPIGILLCTGKDSTLVEYALAGMDNNLFVSKYLLELPSKEEMQAFLERSLKQELL
ncbi:MAG: PDDEXK nuclease domain-containing protein [Candidatus Cloacimonetes bacterium]|nr:PDDEXK nuclease domain-containing protein [Candidatus Cloacimonadota bacterium]